MAHSWESPVNAAREQLLETLEEILPERERRQRVIDLALEEIDRQFAEPDDQMIVAGQEVLDIAGGAQHLTLFFRRKLIEQIWRTMVEKAFGR